MPGFVIHLAVANGYMNKHKNEIKDENEYIKGVLDPDCITLNNKEISKNITHYGKWGRMERR